MLKRQDAVRSRVEFKAMMQPEQEEETAGTKLPLPTTPSLPDSSDDGSDELAPCPSPIAATLTSTFQNCSLMSPCDSP